MTKVIQFCAGPSAGKTTTGLEVASIFKKARQNVLYIPEFAMELVVQGRLKTLEDQLYLFGEQAHRLYNAKDQFDFVVTDAPLFMMLHYMLDGNPKFDGPNEKYWKLTLSDLIMQTWQMYDNEVYFVDRQDRKFLQVGRVQNEQESREIDVHIHRILADQDIPYTTVTSVDAVIDDLRNKGIIT